MNEKYILRNPQTKYTTTSNLKSSINKTMAQTKTLILREQYTINNVPLVLSKCTQLLPRVATSIPGREPTGN